MSALEKTEAPLDGARRLVAANAQGFELEALHEYADAKGRPQFYRIRARNRQGEKWMRPMCLQGGRFKFGEPSATREGKPLYRLAELLAAERAAPVWIVEGEGCADALAAVGVLATTSGSSSSAEGADWTPLAGRCCIVWPDNDQPGKRYSDAVADALRGLGAIVEVIDSGALALPEKGDCVDWLRERPEAGPEALAELPRVRTRDTGGPAPEPLRRPVPPSLPYPVHALGPVIGPACESVHRVVQAPAAVCGASLLAAASLAVQAHADVQNGGRRHPLSLWFLSVAESGERKSAVDKWAMGGVREVEHEWCRDYKAAKQSHDAELEEWTARRDAAKRKEAKGQGLAATLREIGASPEPPLQPTLVLADFTAEGLAKLLIAGRPSLGAFTDEAAVVFGGHGMSRETVARTAGTLSKLWDDGTLDRVRAGDGNVKLWGRRLALHLMAQPVIAEQAFGDDVLAGQGFLARCLLAWPQGTAGTRMYVAENLHDDAAVSTYSGRVRELLRRPLPLAEGERNELDPPALTLSAEAFDTWRRVHDAIEARLKPGGRYAECKPWASKAPEQCLRIAGVLTLFERFGATEIDRPTVERAAELALWHLNEAARLAGSAELSREVLDAEALLNWCHDTGRTLIYSTEVMQKGPSRVREAQRLREAVRELELTNWAERVEGGMELAGRHRRNVWRVLPREEA